MIAVAGYNAKIYYRTDNTSSDVVDATDDATAITVYVVNDGWQEMTADAVFDATQTKAIEDPAIEQDELSTAEPTTFFPRRYVNRVSEPRRRPWQLESGYG